MVDVPEGPRDLKFAKAFLWKSCGYRKKSLAKIRDILGGSETIWSQLCIYEILCGAEKRNLDTIDFCFTRATLMGFGEQIEGVRAFL